MSNEETSADRNVEIWKIKKLIKSLELARGYVFFNLRSMVAPYGVLRNRVISLCVTVVAMVPA